MYTLYQFSSITPTGVFYHLLNHCLHSLHQLTMALTYQHVSQRVPSPMVRQEAAQWCPLRSSRGASLASSTRLAGTPPWPVRLAELRCEGKRREKKEKDVYTCSVHFRKWVAGFSVRIWFRIGTLINKNSQLNASPRFEEQMSWPMAEFAWSFRQSVVLTCVVSFAYRNCPKLIRKIKRAV